MKTINREKAILVQLETGDGEFDESLEELRLLTDTAGGEVATAVEQKREKPDPAYFIGRGKAEEIELTRDELDAELVIFNNDLSPTQMRNLEQIIDGKIIDRTALILDIFAKRALSKEGKLQVELAQLNYILPRLTGRGTYLSRLGGGIGTRGPGETQLEIDRRRIKTKISRLKSEIRQLRKRRSLHRYSRREKGFTMVSLVGYTNAGKSTLLNALTGSEVFIEDKLFATLDPAVRDLEAGDGQRILLADTVGFIRHLPPQLVEAFSATLEEVREADLLLLVVDVSRPDFEELILSVVETLERLQVSGKPQLFVFNKIDLVPSDELEGLQKRLQRDYPSSVFISAEQGMGLEELRHKIVDNLKEKTLQLRLYIPYDQWNSFHFLFREGNVLDVKYENNYATVEVEIPERHAGELSSFLDKPVLQGREKE